MVVCLIDYLFGFVLLCFSALFGSFFRKIRPHLSPPCGCLSRSDGPQEVPGAALISRSISFRVAERPAAVTAHDMPGEGPCFFRAGEHSSRGFSPAGAPPPAPAPPRGPRSAQPTGRFPRGGARKAAQSGTAPPSPDEDSARPQRALLYGGEAPPPIYALVSPTIGCLIPARAGSARRGPGGWLCPPVFTVVRGQDPSARARRRRR